MYWRAILCGIASCAFCVPLLAARASALNNADKRFLDKAADIDMTEAHLGQMAQADASATGVKDFGRKLTRDHTDAYGSLTEVARKAGAEIPKGINVRRDRAVEDLMRLKGDAFDRRFLRDEVRDHERALAEFKREAEQGHDADVKAYASKMVPILEDHLHTAEMLEKSHRHTG